ncbi:hypothetical protein P608_24545 [Comamonas thiooxydans]|uniref:Uncharacterized protein n=1 Tax=Comamonas thiooxydans TaxID=363952 RepID=A0A0E3CB28_9BURK|nr:hypothetical protein P608_24545 [Comamonas thiooxydans]KGH10038.1 hypothetical protein P607_26780 [Comamonas thiooxydans]KGH18282.1 hypothetical protein P606_25045 [Comamonas thiooxydans]
MPERWCPDVCPITGREFFMWIEHWKTEQDVPTYGGPFDSYTIPVKHEHGTFSCERFDHNAGKWMTEGMGWCDLGLKLADDQAFVVESGNPRYDEIRDFAEAPAADALTQAARDVLAERARQISIEDYDPEHDDSHVNDEIAAMAALFLMPEGARDWDATSTSYGDTLAEALLPSDWEMPNFGDDRRRQLVKGTAIGLAEIERFDRAAIAAAKGEQA